MQENFTDKKLLFQLSAMAKEGLSFLTHRSSRISLYPGGREIVTFRAEPQEDSFLQHWYDSRYRTRGLKTIILKDEQKGSVVSPLKEDQEGLYTSAPEVSAQEDTTEAQTETVEVPEEQASYEVESSPVQDQEPSDSLFSEFRDTSPDSWDYYKLQDFIEAKNLKPEGRKKADFIEVVKQYIEEHTEQNLDQDIEEE